MVFSSLASLSGKSSGTIEDQTTSDNYLTLQEDPIEQENKQDETSVASYVLRSNNDTISLNESALTKPSPESKKSSSFLWIASYGASKGDATSNDAQTAATKALQKTPSCCTRFVAELNPCQPWFQVMDKGTGRKIDIPESFAPASCRAFVWKVFCLGFSIATLVYGLVSTDNPEFYFAKVTHWALLFSCLYFVLSVLNTVMAGRTPQPPDVVPCCSRIRWTWVLYELATHLEISVSVLWWVLIYEPGETELTFLAIVPHCVIAALVWADGLFVNSIPVRWTHWYGFVFPVECAYLIWTVLHAYFVEYGNPDTSDNDPDTNDDAIYDVLVWKGEWQKSLIVSVIVLFGSGPIIYFIMWIVSAYQIPCLCIKDRRVYVDSYKDDPNPKPTVDDVEEGSIFARWK